MKTKIKLKKKTKPVRSKVVEPSKISLPLQKVDEVQLLDTDTRILLEMSKPNDFREVVKSAKTDFVTAVQELSRRCGLEAEVRVYFSFKMKE